MVPRPMEMESDMMESSASGRGEMAYRKTSRNRGRGPSAPVVTLRSHFPETWLFSLAQPGPRSAESDICRPFIVSLLHECMITVFRCKLHASLISLESFIVFISFIVAPCPTAAIVESMSKVFLSPPPWSTPDPHTSRQLTAPHTITTWNAEAVCLNSEVCIQGRGHMVPWCPGRPGGGQASTSPGHPGLLRRAETALFCQEGRELPSQRHRLQLSGRKWTESKL